MTSFIAGVLADIRILCSFIASQREAGVDISALVDSQFSSLRARFSQTDFNVNVATTLTEALRGGPWFENWRDVDYADLWQREAAELDRD